MEYVVDELGVQPVYIDQLRRELSFASDALAVRRIVQLIRRLRPTVLHTHTAKAGAVGRVAALLAGSARPPVVVHTFHGHVLRGYFSPTRARTFQQIERVLARRSDALIAVSPEVRDDLVELGVAPAEKIVVVRLGLDLDRRLSADPSARAAVRAELGIPDDGFLIGWLGRMTEIKRVDDLLDACARLRAKGVDAYLALVGDGPLRDELKDKAEALGIADRTRFVGFRESVGELYAAFDVVALTSANEGTPVTVIEALACGLPVVATDVGGVSDVVQDGRSGFLVPANDVAAVAARLEQLAGDPKLCSVMGESGRAFVVPRYSVPRLGEDIDRLYRSLLQEQRRAALTRIHALPGDARDWKAESSAIVVERERCRKPSRGGEETTTPEHRRGARRGLAGSERPPRAAGVRRDRRGDAIHRAPLEGRASSARSCSYRRRAGARRRPRVPTSESPPSRCRRPGGIRRRDAPRGVPALQTPALRASPRRWRSGRVLPEIARPPPQEPGALQCRDCLTASCKVPLGPRLVAETADATARQARAESRWSWARISTQSVQPRPARATLRAAPVPVPQRLEPSGLGLPDGDRASQVEQQHAADPAR